MLKLGTCIPLPSCTARCFSCYNTGFGSPALFRETDNPMTYVIAEPCIGTKDTACVDACPVDCIHPKKGTTYDDGRPTFDEVPQLYIDPVECIDCGACVPVCPVSAIFVLEDLPEKWTHFAELNASYVTGGKFTPDEYAKHQTPK